MSLYNMLFGRNPQSSLLLAVIGLRENDVERLRDVSVADDGRIEVYTRTGGGNREDYPNLIMRRAPGWAGSVDDEFDYTYCTDTFEVPTEWAADVAGLSDVLTHGLRAAFVQHLAKTLRREPTEDDLRASAFESEKGKLAATAHIKANGHTFVPLSDPAMEVALKLAEANGGQLLSCWGIMPLALDVRQNHVPFPNAVDPKVKTSLTRAEIGYSFKWEIDTEYWAHCVERFSADYPLTMAKIGESVDSHLARQARQ